VSLPRFELLRPRTVAEASAALLGRPGSRCLAGGTDLLVAMRHGVVVPDRLVDLSEIAELHTLERTEVGLFVGACVTLRRLIRELESAGDGRAVLEAAQGIASPVLRAMGTVGGNLCLDTRCTYLNQSREWRARHSFCLRSEGAVCAATGGGSRCVAVFSADLPPALFAVGATAEIGGLVDGAFRTRSASVDTLYAAGRLPHLTLAPGEVVLGVSIPFDPSWRSGYEKLRWRGSIDFPAVGVGLCVKLRKGRIDQARVALSGMAPTPLVAEGVADRLVGERPGSAVFDSAAEVIAKGARLVNNHATGPKYRRTVSAAVFRRLCERVCHE